MNIFGGNKRTCLKDELRHNDRRMLKVNRELNKEYEKIQNIEKKLEIDIKKMFQQGNKHAYTALAKQLLEVRKQKLRLQGTTSKITAVSNQSKVVESNKKLAQVISVAGNSMNTMNKHLDPIKLNQTVQNFKQEMNKLDLKDDLVNDTLDEIFRDPDDEIESEIIINQVLDEIGIEMSDKISKVPTAPKSEEVEESLEKRLCKLRMTNN